MKAGISEKGVFYYVYQKISFMCDHGNPRGVGAGRAVRAVLLCADECADGSLRGGMVRLSGGDDGGGRADQQRVASDVKRLKTPCLQLSSCIRMMYN